ncbi:peptide chain release factor N(5)-glutamine methyltransferase [Zhihengliuella halotolerans]|uniref:Release factor glutamine methyltransferase n=1 Tax=Zhihengliuella halotolerans TaxID=370736 RepID=A0A4Q8ADE6_9MICC|nr:peptide chain release factor N(5)-glutamine methyltransferase [Zhihengliuella halotolerans]RZU61675.1 release factor glutamine methyltransferase [Zhihengliuella halotolerans]
MGTTAELASALRAASAVLAEAGVPSPRVDAELLAAHLLGVSRGRVGALALAGAPAPAGLDELVAERARRIPLQHLTGVAHFRHLDLAVGPGVFVPRPETETLAQLGIDAARAAVAATGGATVVDLGTGSGAVAAAIASEVPAAVVHAVELSEHAAAWAERNLTPLGVELRVGDLRTAFEDLDGRVDVVVSNPPYIPADAVPNEPEVRDHDPELALYGGGADGMELPRAVEATARRLLSAGGYVALEHAEVQERAMQALFERTGAWADVAGHRDLTDRARCTSARRAG